MGTKQWTAERLEAALRELVAERGDVSCRAFCREVGVSVGRIERVFGSWAELRGRCGLAPKKAVGKRVSAEAIRGALREAVEEYGAGVTLQQFERRSGFSRSVIYARFESWTALRALEGLPENERGSERVEFEELIGELVRLRDKLGRIPNTREIAKQTKFALSTYYNRVGPMPLIRVLLTSRLFQRAVRRRLQRGTLTHAELKQAREDRDRKRANRARRRAQGATGADGSLPSL